MLNIFYILAPRQEFQIIPGRTRTCLTFQFLDLTYILPWISNENELTYNEKKKTKNDKLILAWSTII